MILSRRGVLCGLIAAPIIVAVGKVMPVKAHVWAAPNPAIPEQLYRICWIRHNAGSDEIEIESLGPPLVGYRRYLSWIGSSGFESGDIVSMPI